MARTSERLDRKALKEDALLNAVEQAGEYVRAHMNLVLGVIAGIAVVLVLGYLWRQDSRQKTTQADESLSQLVIGYTNGQFGQVIEQSNQLQASKPGTKAAILTRYISGASQLRLGQFAEAEQSLRAYLESASTAPFYENAARQALAASLEGQGKFAEAAPIYQELAGRFEEPQASEAQLSAARALDRAGSTAESRAILEKLAAGTTPTARDAKLELAVLNARP